ncbi:MAG: Abi-alpha family protein [Sporichthyaceae bacterium]
MARRKREEPPTVVIPAPPPVEPSAPANGHGVLERFDPRRLSSGALEARKAARELFATDLRELGARSLDRDTYAGVGGLVRFAAGTGVRISAWAVHGTVTAATDLVRQVASGEPVTDIVDRQVEIVRSTVVKALALNNTPLPSVITSSAVRVANAADEVTPAQLREQGDSLLRHVGTHGGGRTEHPAFPRILRELLPDEARIIRFMALAGPQPAIDVRTKTPLGVGSELIAIGLNLVAEMSGCTYPERNPQYLANLDRLGMICFSDEQVEDPRRYSFIEAQPAASAAMERAKKTMSVYRSVHITQFGLQFAQSCFTLDGYDAGGWLKDVR